MKRLKALGAIGQEESSSVLKKYSNHPSPEISETCQIAVDLINWKRSGEKCAKGIYLSHDPAPPTSALGVVSLKLQLLDKSKSLFERYRAMFALRDMNSDESALALLEGFNDTSALFRHEIAYVLGQMQRSVTVDGLSAVLRDEAEHRMVRHEAAEVKKKHSRFFTVLFIEDACCISFNINCYCRTNDSTYLN